MPSPVLFGGSIARSGCCVFGLTEVPQVLMSLACHLTPVDLRVFFTTRPCWPMNAPQDDLVNVHHLRIDPQPDRLQWFARVLCRCIIYRRGEQKTQQSERPPGPDAASLARLTRPSHPPQHGGPEVSDLRPKQHQGPSGTPGGPCGFSRSQSETTGTQPRSHEHEHDLA